MNFYQLITSKAKHQLHNSVQQCKNSAPFKVNEMHDQGCLKRLRVFTFLKTLQVNIELENNDPNIIEPLKKIIKRILSLFHTLKNTTKNKPGYKR